MTKKSKVKVAHLIWSLDRGGCETYLLRTLPILKTQNIFSTVFAFKRDGNLLPEFKKAKIKVVIVNPFNIFTALRVYSPDLVLSYLFYADAMARLVSVFTKHKVVPFLRCSYNTSQYWPVWIFEKLTSPFVSNYFANSVSIRHQFANFLKISPSKFTVVPNGIDVTKWRAVKKDLKLATTIGLKRSDTVFISVGNLLAYKGHSFLLNAFRKLSTKNKSVKLIIVGEGPERQNLEHYIQTNQLESKVILLGSRSDVPSLLKLADVFVHPTLVEGMSNAILEAMAAGLPVITTNIPENKSMDVNKKSFLYIRPKDSNKLFQALKQMEDFKVREQYTHKSKTLVRHYELRKTIQIFDNEIRKHVK